MSEWIVHTSASFRDESLLMLVPAPAFPSKYAGEKTNVREMHRSTANNIPRLTQTFTFIRPAQRMSTVIVETAGVSREVALSLAHSLWHHRSSFLVDKPNSIPLPLVWPFSRSAYTAVNRHLARERIAKQTQRHYFVSVCVSQILEYARYIGGIFPLVVRAHRCVLCSIEFSYSPATRAFVVGVCFQTLDFPSLRHLYFCLTRFENQVTKQCALPRVVTRHCLAPAICIDGGSFLFCGWPGKESIC